MEHYLSMKMNKLKKNKNKNKKKREWINYTYLNNVDETCEHKYKERMLGSREYVLCEFIFT